MRKIVTIVLLTTPACAAGLGGIGGGPRPAWLDGNEPKYAEAQFLTGVGMLAPQPGQDGDALRAAVDAAARVELVKKLEVSVSAELTAIEKETNIDQASHSEQRIEQQTREVVRAVDLQGVEVRERWHDADAGVVYALAVWPRARAEAVLKAGLTEAETAARQAESQGDQAAERDPGAALRQYLAARGHIEKAVQQSALLRAITGKAATPPDASGVRRKLEALVASLALKVESGDGQRVKPGEAAPQPVVIKLTAGDRPLGGVPVVADLPTGRVDGKAQTDPEGRATLRVASAGPMATGEVKGEARVDWAALAGGGDAPPAWAAALPPLNASFRIVAKSLASTRLLVKVIEKIEGAPEVKSGVVQSAMQNLFGGAGFTVQDGEALLSRVSEAALLTLDPVELQSKARDLADVVVVAEAATGFSSTLSGDVVIHRARMNLRVVDLGTGRVLTTDAREVKGQPGKGPEKAGRKALDVLAGQLDAAIAAKVKAELGL